MRLVILALCALLPSLALAQPKSATAPATIDFTQPLLGVDGKPLMRAVCLKFSDSGICANATEVAWTLSDLAADALSLTDANETGDDQVHRQYIIGKLYDRAQVTIGAQGADLTEKDATLICDRIAAYVANPRAMQNSRLTFDAWMILDPARVK